MRAASKRRFDPVYWNIIEVTVILFFVETTYLPVKSWIILFYNLIVYIKILYSHKIYLYDWKRLYSHKIYLYDWKRKENILKIGLKFQTTKEKPRVKPWYLVAREPIPHYDVH